MQYFKHFTKMRTDPKIRRLFAKYGFEGYGLYNLILESIAEGIETDNPLPFLEETCDDLALFYNANSTKVEEMVRFMIQNGLLSIETVDKKVACYKIYKYLEQSQTRSEKIRELIAAYKDVKEVLDVSDCLRLSETNMIEENRIDKEENKKRTRKQKDLVNPTQDEIEKYVIEKQFVINPVEFFKWYDPEWVDRDGNKIVNWKNKAKNWNSRELKKNPGALPYSKPISSKAIVSRRCKHIHENGSQCEGEIFNSYCKVCGTMYDGEGNEIF